ncbi:hypothetical protein [Nonomuraea sp. 10N515B]
MTTGQSAATSGRRVPGDPLPGEGFQGGAGGYTYGLREKGRVRR